MIKVTIATIGDNEELNIKRKNALLDDAIRSILKCYPCTAVRKVLEDVDNKYDNIILTHYRRMADLERPISRYNWGDDIAIVAISKYNKAVNEFLVETAKFLHSYMDYSVNELPSICLTPYVKHMNLNLREKMDVVNCCCRCGTIKDVIELDPKDEAELMRCIAALMASSIL